MKPAFPPDVVGGSTVDPRPSPAGLQPIRILLAGIELSGWVDAGDQRMTDILRAGEPFAFLPVGGDAGAWLDISPDETWLVFPPPHVSSPEQRVPRNQHQVLVRLGDTQVTGTAYLRPGEQDDPILRATRRFLPLTDAAFVRGDRPEETADVVIVNLRWVEEFRTVDRG